MNHHELWSAPMDANTFSAFAWDRSNAAAQIRLCHPVSTGLLYCWRHPASHEPLLSDLHCHYDMLRELDFWPNQWGFVIECKCNPRTAIIDLCSDFDIEKCRQDSFFNNKIRVRNVIRNMVRNLVRYSTIYLEVSLIFNLRFLNRREILGSVI